MGDLLVETEWIVTVLVEGRCEPLVATGNLVVALAKPPPQSRPTAGRGHVRLFPRCFRRPTALAEACRARRSLRGGRSDADDLTHEDGRRTTLRGCLRPCQLS